MTIEQYLRCMRVLDNKKLSDFEKSARTVSILRGIKPNDLRRMRMARASAIIQGVEAELKAAIKSVEPHDEYEIDGVTYVTMKKIAMMTAIQFSDLTNVIRNGAQGETDDERARNLEKYLPTLMSIMLIPKGARYPDFDRFESEERLAAHMDIRDAKAIANFCKGLSSISQRNILTSLIVTERTAWIGVPKWRRVLVRKIINILLTPSVKHLRRSGVL